VTREREDIEDVEVAAVVDEADVEENIEDEEVIVEAVAVKTEVSEGAEGVKTEVTEGTADEEVVGTETVAETEVATVEIKMADSRTENSDPVAIGVDPEGKVVEDVEVNLIATTNDPNNNQMAIEKMATTKKLRQTEDKKTEKTPKQQKNKKFTWNYPRICRTRIFRCWSTIT